MYSDLVKNRFGWLWLVLAAAVLLAAVTLLLGRGSSRELEEESAAAIREAVRRCALQCYAVEGVHPPDIAYLEDNYGLQVNRRDYYVTYEAFSSNLPPTVLVTAK